MQDADRSQGYVTDASYTDRFFRELAPSWLAYVAALHGLTPPAIDRPFSYLELGCGLGTSTVVNAGAYPRARFHACDINPSHIAAGTTYAEALGVENVHWHEASFDDLLALDLPAFDFIVLHGVYSWVSADARRAVRDVIRAHAKPGALVYVSYNCQPGWAVEAPLRRLLVELASTASGDSSERTKEAVGILKSLDTAKARYFSAQPSASAAVDSYVRSQPNYLAHEFLNETWETFYSIDVAREMEAIGLRLIGSATLADNHPMLVADPKAIAITGRLDHAQRQLAMDFAANRRFRRDVFVRGDVVAAAGQPTPFERIPVGTIGSLEDLVTKARVPRGEVHFQEDFILDLRGRLASGARTIGDLAHALAPRAPDRDELLRNFMFLLAGGALIPFAQVQTPRTPTASAAPTTPAAPRPVSPLVERALAQTIAFGATRAVPCEAAGNGVPVHPVEAVALQALVAGVTNEDDLAAAIASDMQAYDLSVTHEGQTLTREIEFESYGPVAAQHAIGRVLPTLTRLGLFV